VHGTAKSPVQNQIFFTEKKSKLSFHDIKMLLARNEFLEEFYRNNCPSSMALDQNQCEQTPKSSNHCITGSNNSELTATGAIEMSTKSLGNIVFISLQMIDSIEFI